MADAKAAKLAAAWRKLKDHQEKKNVQPSNTTILATETVNPSQYVEVQENITQVVENEGNLKIQNLDLSIGHRSTILDSQVHHTFNNTVDPMETRPAAALAPQQNDQQRELHQHMQHHIKATEILVSDKRNLESKVHCLEESLRNLESKHAETIAALNTAKQSSQKLDIELRDSKELVKTLDNKLKSKSNEVESYKLMENKLVESKSELEEKLDSTMTQLTARSTEVSSLTSQLSQMHRELDITQLHLQQLTNGGTVTENDTALDPNILIAQNKSLQYNNSRLEEQVMAVQSERERLATHYQQYIHQLNEQLESAMANCRKKNVEVKELIEREARLVEQICEMEISMQALKNHISVLDKQEYPLTMQQPNDELAELKLKFSSNKAQLNLLDENYKHTKRQLSEKELKIAELTKTIQTLQIEQPDITKLSAANESDKVAAQRATVQNNKLKEELHGLQDAFVVMSNDKLELTEKLQAEKFLNRELTIKLAELEETLKDIENKLMAKDGEMIRLQANCSKLEKELLQNTQEIDRLRHYEVTQSTDEVLRMELENAQQVVSQLKLEVAALRRNDNQFTTADNSIENAVEPTTVPIIATKHWKESVHQTNEKVVTDSNLNVLPTEDAMIKLQQRFLKTMKEVAELSDEKQNLEHIVLQLQSETETICEYIALYQQQRGILKQREEERVAQMKYLAAERERMQTQLEELQHMITGGGSDVAGAPQIQPHFQQEKVEKIVNLLSEIKQSHLIDPNTQCSGLENFHPCPWCSGKLINV